MKSWRGKPLKTVEDHDTSSGSGSFPTHIISKSGINENTIVWLLCSYILSSAICLLATFRGRVLRDMDVWSLNIGLSIYSYLNLT